MLSIFPCNWFASVPALFFYLSIWSSLDILASWNNHKPRQETLEICEIDGTWPNCEKAYPQTRQPNAHKKRLRPGYGRSRCFIFSSGACATTLWSCQKRLRAIKHWTEYCCFCMVLSSGASPVPLRITAPLCCQCDVHVTSYNLTQSIFRLLHMSPLDNSWAESPLHRHDRGTPPADEGVICTQIRWKPLQSPRWNAICFAHTAWTPWWSDFPLGSDQARNKVRVWLRLCWKGQADPKFGCLINKD